MPHHRPKGEGYRMHEVMILPGTMLEEIVGASRIKVNSSHHQEVKSAGDGLGMCAVSPAGHVVEGVESREPSRLGVQWHPETHEDQPDPVFTAFVAAASLWAGQQCD